MFNVSTRTRYGLSALSYVASKQHLGPVSIQEIAKEQKLSKKYLENIFTLLKKGNIVRSSRGPEGGYELSRNPEDITVYSVMDALDGPIVTVSCVGDATFCTLSKDCKGFKLWHDLQEHILDFLRSRTLVDLMEAPRQG